MPGSAPPVTAADADADENGEELMSSVLALATAAATTSVSTGSAGIVLIPCCDFHRVF
jgi:hypothetical protein